MCEVVEINSYGKALGTPNDPLSGSTYQYYLNHSTRPDINATEAWDLWKGNSSVVIAVLDDGIKLNPQHPDHNLGSGYGWNVGWDFVDNDDNPDANHYSHGTNVAGVAAALTNNSIGVAGVCGGWGYDGAQIMAVRVIEHINPDSSIIYSQNVDDAIIWAADHGAKIINMSFKVDQLGSITSALRYAYGQKGCLLVAAAGNDPDETTPYFPARDVNVMAIAGIKWKFWDHYGNTGNQIDVAAPAEDIFNTIYDWPYYGYFSGTSQAAPQVAGTAALVWSYYTTLISKDLRNIINQTAEDIGATGFDDEFGNGLLKADQALLFEDYMPPKPSGISINAPVGGHPTISWNTVDDPEVWGYYVYRSSSDDLGRYNLIKVAEVDHDDGQSTHSWTDNAVTVANPKFAPITYYYRVTSVNYDLLESIVSGEVNCGSNTIWKMSETDEEVALSLDYNLYQNYPNPFNPTTKITYSLKESGNVQIKVYDVLGRMVQELVSTNQEAGVHSINFDASALPSGVYYYIMASGRFHASKKMLLIK